MSNLVLAVDTGLNNMGFAIFDWDTKEIVDFGYLNLKKRKKDRKPYYDHYTIHFENLEIDKEVELGVSRMTPEIIIRMIRRWISTVKKHYANITRVYIDDYIYTLGRKVLSQLAELNGLYFSLFHLYFPGVKLIKVGPSAKSRHIGAMIPKEFSSKSKKYQLRDKKLRKEIMVKQVVKIILSSEYDIDPDEFPHDTADAIALGYYAVHKDPPGIGVGKKRKKKKRRKRQIKI